MCLYPDGHQAVITAAACSFAHVLALADDGTVYSWGLNCKGQLGLDDIRARHFPEILPTVDKVTKIFASGHSSACIDKFGKLYTWGSGANHRLMQVPLCNCLMHTVVLCICVVGLSCKKTVLRDDSIPLKRWELL